MRSKLYGMLQELAELKTERAALIDRTSGEARSFHVDDANAANIVPIVRKNVAKESTIATDEASHYNSLNQDYYHGTVNHSAEEWVVGEFHTNSAEGYFSHFKRSVRGTYSHTR